MTEQSRISDRFSARVAWALLGLGALAGVVYLATPSIALQGILYSAVGALCLITGAVVLALRFGRVPLGWALLLGSAGAWLIGDALWTGFGAIGYEVPFPSPIDGLYLAGYPLAVAGVILIWRRCTTGALGGILDSCIAATGVGLFAWAAVIDTSAEHASVLTLITATAYPTFDVLLFIALAQLLVVGRLAGNRSIQALAAGMALFLVADFFYAHAAVRNSYGDGVTDLGWFALYVLWGAAAAHPSTRALMSGSKPQVRMTTRRLAMIAAACLLAPAALVVARFDGTGDLSVFAVSGSLLVVFVFWRMTLMFREERRSAEELHRSREVYRVLVDESPDMVALTDGDGRVVFASQSHLRILDYSPEEIVGTLGTDFLHPDDRAPVREKLTGLLESGQRTELAFRFIRRDGAVLQAEMTATRLDDRADGTRLVLATTREVTERQRVESALAVTTQKLQTLVDSAPVGILAVDLDGIVNMWNPEAEEMFGWSADEVLGKWTPLVTQEEFQALALRLIQGDEIQDEAMRPHKDGHQVAVIANIVLQRDVDGEPIGSFGVFVDVSERHALEERLRQAQKMEAVGQLAGGIAHDFNNLLTGISGYTELALGRVGNDDARIRHDLKEVARASERATELTRQLLAFSRRQLLQATVFDLNDAVVQTTGLLGRVLGEHIRIVASLDPTGCYVHADQSQIEQVLMNLAVNARDAQPDGGTVALETENVTFDPGDGPQDLPPGRYVRLRVSDTGEGMDSETAERAFEPFFTTKDTGKGTGLGLSTVYGIVTQSGGAIELRTGLGTGTTFEIFLPRTTRPAQAAPPPERVQTAGGRERILLVEDEAIVRQLTCELLESRGYAVTSAAGPEEALELAVREPIDLLLTDIVMPQMSGHRLAEALRRDRPSLPIVYMSGYSDDAALRDGSLQADGRFLQKPYSSEELAWTVRAALDSRAQTSSSSASSSAATTS